MTMYSETSVSSRESFPADSRIETTVRIFTFFFVFADIEDIDFFMGEEERTKEKFSPGKRESNSLRRNRSDAVIQP